MRAWNPQQQQWAEYVAAGYSQRRASFSVGVDDRTGRKWWAIPEMREYVEDIRAELMASQRPLFESTVLLSQQLVLGALTGEFPPDDPRINLAREVLRTTVWRVVVPGNTSVGDGQQPKQLGPGDAA